MGNYGISLYIAYLMTLATVSAVALAMFVPFNRTIKSSRCKPTDSAGVSGMLHYT